MIVLAEFAKEWKSIKVVNMLDSASHGGRLSGLYDVPVMEAVCQGFTTITNAFTTVSDRWPVVILSAALEAKFEYDALLWFLLTHLFSM